MDLPLVSVVLIFLNSERFIAEAINSVLAQTFSDWELVLVDDGSTDQSTAIAQEYAASHPRIHYLEHSNHENRGMSVSRNFGAHHSTAPYIAFIDSDDVWFPNKIADQLAVLQTRPEVALVCGALLYWHSWDPTSGLDDKLVLTGGIADRTLVPPEAILSFYPLGPGAGAGLDILVRRDALQAVGGFEEQFHGMYEDQAFLLKIFLVFPIFISSKPWLKYRQHPASCCATATASHQEYRMRRKAFLDWFGEYLQQRECIDPVVVRRLQTARVKLRFSLLRDVVQRGRAIMYRVVRIATLAS
jgi:glycosyltransferase involved in cell wall biosynthesis